MSTLLTTSPAGREAIRQHEGNKLVAYQDGGGVWTIGVGHTSAAGAPKVTPGLRITAAESDAILARDLAKFEAAVRQAVKVPVAQHEFDALVSLAFNIGGDAFARSTVVRRLNTLDRLGAADAFLMWNKDNGRVIKGLVNRRQAERRQFLAAGSAVAARKPSAVVADKVVATVRRLALDPSVPGIDPSAAGSVASAVIQDVAPVIEHLANQEDWWRSRVTLGSLGAIAAGTITIVTGISARSTDPELYASGLASIIGGSVALYGRWMARKPLGS